MGRGFRRKNNITTAVNSGEKQIHRKAPASLSNDCVENGDFLQDLP